MDIVLLAAGRVRAGPERALVDDYVTRASQTGRRVALGPVVEREVDPKSGHDAVAVSAAIRAAAEDADVLVILDERGQDLASPDWAKRLEAWRDQGRRRVAVCVGGADGFDEAARAAGDLVVRFGRATWPHKLARVMAAEQIYRAVSIASGSAYHHG